MYRTYDFRLTLVNQANDSIVVGKVPKLFVINMNATMHYVAAARVVFGGDPGAVQTWRVMNF